MSTINNIAHYYKGKDNTDEYSRYTDKDKAIILELALTVVCENLYKAHLLTYSKSIDIEYLLNVVGSYLMGMQEGHLNEQTERPSKLFEESLYPSLQNISEVTKELIDDSTEDSGPTKELDAE